MNLEKKHCEFDLSKSVISINVLLQYVQYYVYTVYSKYSHFLYLNRQEGKSYSTKCKTKRKNESNMLMLYSRK